MHCLSYYGLVLIPRNLVFAKICVTDLDQYLLYLHVSGNTHNLRRKNAWRVRNIFITVNVDEIISVAIDVHYADCYLRWDSSAETRWRCRRYCGEYDHYIPGTHHDKPFLDNSR